MGLAIRATGFNEEIYHSGYMGFTWFRIELAKSYNPEFGILYEKWARSHLTKEELSEAEINRMNELCNPDLDLFLQHSDCDGKLTPKECKLIYDVTKNLKCDYRQRNYITDTGKNQLEVFNRAFLHCWKRRVIMRFE